MVGKEMTPTEAIANIESGMTIGIGGWGSRRKPMALVRALLASQVTDLTVVTFGGPDVGLLADEGRIRKLIYGFVSLDSIPLDPLFTRARENASFEVEEYDEGMFVTGLRAATQRLSFLPTRAGIGSDVLSMNPHIKMVQSPYNGEEYVAMKALPLDVALIHVNRSDRFGNGQYLGPDPYFDDLYAMAAKHTFMSTEKVVETEDLLKNDGPQTLLVSRMYVDGVVATPNGAHFTSCEPDYARDELFQRQYADSARDEVKWNEFKASYLTGDEHSYQRAIADLHGSTVQA